MIPQYYMQCNALSCLKCLNLQPQYSELIVAIKKNRSIKNMVAKWTITCFLQNYDLFKLDIHELCLDGWQLMLEKFVSNNNVSSQSCWNDEGNVLLEHYIISLQKQLSNCVSSWVRYVTTNAVIASNTISIECSWIFEPAT